MASSLPSSEDNGEAENGTAQSSDIYDDLSRPPSSLRPIEPEVVARPTSTLEASVLAPRPSTSNSNPDSPGAPNNDHNYTLSPGTSSASSAASTPVNNSNRNGAGANLNNIEIAQLNKHLGN